MPRCLLYVRDGVCAVILRFLINMVADWKNKLKSKNSLIIKGTFLSYRHALCFFTASTLGNDWLHLQLAHIERSSTQDLEILVMCEGVDVTLVHLNLTILSMTLPSLHLVLHIQVPVTLGIQYCIGTLWGYFTSFPSPFSQPVPTPCKTHQNCLTEFTIAYTFARASFSAKCHQQIIILSVKLLPPLYHSKN